PPISTLFPYTTLFRSRDRSPHFHPAPKSSVVATRVASGSAPAGERAARAARIKSAPNCSLGPTLRLQPLQSPTHTSWETGRNRRDRKSTRLNSSHVKI